MLAARFYRFALAISGVLVLASCGGDQSDAPASISGMIKNEKGPVQAQLEVVDAKNTVIASAATDADSSYRIAIPEGTVYPIVIRAKTNDADGKEIVLKGVLVGAGNSNLAITPDTTWIVDAAIARGGLTPQNIGAATAALLSQKPDREGSEKPKEVDTRGPRGFR